MLSSERSNERSRECLLADRVSVRSFSHVESDMESDFLSVRLDTTGVL